MSDKDLSIDKRSDAVRNKIRITSLEGMFHTQNNQLGSANIKIGELEKDVKAWADGQRIGAKEIAELREKINNVRVVRDDGLMFAAESLDKLQTQLNELKERVEGIYKSVHGIAPNKPDIIIEVLRESYEFRVAWCKKAISMDNKLYILAPEQVLHLQEQVDFYGVLLEKLDGDHI